MDGFPILAGVGVYGCIGAGWVDGHALVTDQEIARAADAHGDGCFQKAEGSFAIDGAERFGFSIVWVSKGKQALIFWFGLDEERQIRSLKFWHVAGDHEPVRVGCGVECSCDAGERACDVFHFVTDDPVWGRLVHAIWDGLIEAEGHHDGIATGIVQEFHSSSCKSASVRVDEGCLVAAHSQASTACENQSLEWSFVLGHRESMVD